MIALEMFDRVAVLGLTLSFGAALFFPATDSVSGFHALIGLPLVLIFPAWHANPLFWLGIIGFWFHDRILASLFGFTGAALALTSLFFESAANLRSGYYLWVFTLLMLGTLAAVGERLASLQECARRGD